MIGGWLCPCIRHEIQDELIALQHLVTCGRLTLEQANDAIRRVMEVTDAVKAGIITETQSEALIAQMAFAMEQGVQS